MLEKTFSSSRKQKSQLQWVCVGLVCFDFFTTWLPKTALTLSQPLILIFAPGQP